MKTLFLGWLLLLSVTALAQDDFYRKDQPKPTKRQYAITLQDGTKLIGELIRQDSTEAVIKTTTVGQVTIKADQITSMVVVGADKPETAGYSNLFSQYLNFTPTAYTAERGKLYFRNSLLYYSQFDYGINDNWSVGAGFFTFVPTALISLNTKVSFPVSPKVRLGVQGQYITGAITGLTNEFKDGLGYVQGIASIGTSQRNVTFGIGAVLTKGELSQVKVLTLGFVRKVSPSLTFISENHVFIGDNAGTNLTLSGGLRFDRRRHSFDVSAVAPFSPDNSPSVILVPFASYQLRIGK